MDIGELLQDAFGRIGGLVPSVVDGLDDEQLAHRPDRNANPVGWLVWHQARVLDDHVSGVARTEQVWTAEGWIDRFALELPADDIGYGHSSAQVGLVRAPGELLVGYAGAATRMAQDYVAGLGASDLDRVVDAAWDPPVRAGVRLVSVLSDCLQHLGQAAYLRGLLRG